MEWKAFYCMEKEFLKVFFFWNYPLNKNTRQRFDIRIQIQTIRQKRNQTRIKGEWRIAQGTICKTDKKQRFFWFLIGIGLGFALLKLLNLL